jgi:membrane associated rhomboid family serine protease
MLFVPLTGKISWRNPPFVTISIIIINCLVFFLWQKDEEKLFLQAETFYFNSGLADIEIPRYIEYLNLNTADASSFQHPEKMDEKVLARLYQNMAMDFQFLVKLYNGEIILPEDPLYPEWIHLRQRYDEKLFKVPILKYGFRPAYKTPITFMSYMFLHGSAFHLIGNMIFLWLVGCFLEQGCGRFLYTLAYLFIGLVSAAVYGLFYAQSLVPLVGASGAISGLMGAFTVLYGKKKIKFFYYIGFYFNYLMVPAIVLLPIWLANELVQLFFSGITHVAYVAHIGGLLCGAVVGNLYLSLIGDFNREVLEKETTEAIEPLLESAYQRIRELDLQGGRRLLEQVLVKDPQNIDALKQLFNIEKLDPVTSGFHATVQKLLAYYSRNPATYETAYRIYREYSQLTEQSHLLPQTELKLSFIFCGLGHLAKSEKMMSSLMQKNPDLPGLSTVLLKLANAYWKNKMFEKAKQCHKIICNNYPDSAEAVISRKWLSRSR